MSSSPTLPLSNATGRAAARAGKERAIRVFLYLCGGVFVLTTTGIVVIQFFESFHFFREVSIVKVFTGSR